MGCGRPKPGVETVNVRVQERKISGPLNFVNGCGVALARRSFLSRFGDDRIARCLGVGEVRGPENQLILDWVTFIGRRVLFVRGSKNAQYRTCSLCGRNLYFAMGKKYLYPHPPKDIELFQSHLWGLIVPRQVGETTGIKESDGVWIDKLPVLDKPLDGLPPLVTVHAPGRSEGAG
jgi:hypothetical protein